MQKDKKIYLFANWKMYLNLDESMKLAEALARESFSSEIAMAVFPTALAVTGVKYSLRTNQAIAVGAQNTHWINRGGYTGEVSAEMYRAAGCEYALVGHSERRHMFSETNHEVRQKVEATLLAGLNPVVCVGESAEERDNGKTKEILEVQLRAAFEDIEWPLDRKVIVAYEPVWAISKGTEPSAGYPCDPDQAESIHALIYNFLDSLVPQREIILLYGGSVRPNNVVNYVAAPHIAGVLVGAAAAKLESWKEIIAAVSSGIN